VNRERDKQDCATGGTSETDDGSKSEVRGTRNFEPWTSNLGSRLSCISRASRSMGADGLFQHPARNAAHLNMLTCGCWPLKERWGHTSL